MGCCCCGSRASSIFAAIFSLIQGSAWLGFAISGLQFYDCTNTLVYADGFPDPPEGTISVITDFFMNMLTLTYFYNNDCPDNKRPNMTVNITYPAHTTVSVIWADQTQPAVDRTYSWMLTYIVLTSLWLAASILLLIVAVSNKKGSTASRLHYPWILVMAAIVVADVVASVMYFLDIPDTKGLLNFFKFAGVNNTDSFTGNTNLPNLGGEYLTAIPSMVMGVVFIRGIIFWIFNLSLLGVVIQCARRIARQKTSPPANSNPNPYLRTVNAPQEPPNSQQSPQQRQLRYQDPETFNRTPPPTLPKPNRNSIQFSQQPAQLYPPQYPQQPYQMPPEPQAYTNPQQYQQPTQYQQQPQQFQYNPNYQPSKAYNNPQQSYNNQGYHNTEPIDPRSATHDYQEVRPQILMPREGNMKGPPTPKKPTPSTPVKRTDSIPTNTELRSQLPWSYVQHRDEPIAVKKQQKIDEDDEDAPPIPIPDYTLHFPRRPRGDNPQFPAIKTSQHHAAKNKGYDVLY